MPIDAHDNPELQGTGPGRAALAAGSSNSNSHNAGGGGSEASVQEMRDTLTQLQTLLPRLQQAVERGPNA